MRRWRLSLAASAVVLAGCLTDGHLKDPTGHVPAVSNDGWEVASPPDVGLSQTAVDGAYDRFFAEDDFYSGIALLIVRHGKLVAEGYARDLDDRTRIHHVASITKSVTSLVFGVLHDRGTFSKLDERLMEILPPSSFTGDPRTDAITLEHLLTMSSGLDISNDIFGMKLLMRRPKHQDRVILSRPLYADPGTEFYYRDADPQLLSYAIQARTGRTLASLTEELLFEPLGIDDTYWQENVDGVTLGAHGLWIRARDLAKIGQLVLNKGRWEGVRIVSEDWIRTSTRTHVMPGPDDPVTSGFGYGYYWWVVPELNGPVAWGHGGQYIVVLPDADMVVVLTALPDADNDVGKPLKEFLPTINQLLNGIEAH